jgi:K+-sensing histidine kinase KdpD
MLLRELDMPKQKHFAALINEESVHLGHIIDDLLDISRLEAKRNLALTRESVSITDLIGKILTPIIESTATHQIVIEQSVDMPVISADPFRLGQVIKNLVSNILKRTAPSLFAAD